MIPGDFALPGYELEHELASGASGTVYRAVQKDLGRVVAVKMLAAGLFDHEETRARFVREARIQAKLSHPSLLGLYDAGVCAGHPYLVMELVDGGSLRDRLDRQGALPLAEAIRINAEVCSGLAAAHAAGIIHRDLKPENVLLTAEGAAKVADFGLAKGAGKGTFQTSTGVVLGTPGYMAPEVIRGAEASPSADVYAAGVMLYETIAGRRPFAGEDFMATFQLQLAGAAPPLGKLRSGVPAMLEELVTRAISADAGTRPGSAGELLAELTALPAFFAVEDAAVDLRLRASGAVRTALGSASGTQARARPPSGTRVKAALRTSASRPGAPKPAVRQERVTSAAKRVMPAGAAVLAAVSLALLALALARSRQKVSAPTPPAASITRARPGAPALPSFEQLTSGSRQVHLRLSEAALPGTKLVFRGKGPEAIVREVPANMRDLTFDLPEPSRRWQVALDFGGRRVTSTFDTLAEAKPLRPRVAPCILEDQGDPDLLNVAARGEDVAVSWVRINKVNGQDLRQAMLRSSPDGGLTWTPPFAISLPELDVRRAAMAWSDEGLHVAWTEAVPKSGTWALWHRFRSDRMGTWSQPEALGDTVGQSVALARDDEGGVEMAYCGAPPPDSTLPRVPFLNLRRLGPGPRMGPPDSVSKWPDATEGELDFITRGPNRFCVVHRSTDRPAAFLYEARSPGGSGASWTGFVSRTLNGIQLRHLTFAALGTEGLMAFDHDEVGSVRIVSLGTSGRALEDFAFPFRRETLGPVLDQWLPTSEWVKDPDLQLQAQFPAFARTRSGLLMGCLLFPDLPRPETIYFTLTSPSHLGIFSSANGKSWAPCWSTPLPPASAYRGFKLVSAPTHLVVLLAYWHSLVTFRLPLSELKTP